MKYQIKILRIFWCLQIPLLIYQILLFTEYGFFLGYEFGIWVYFGVPFFSVYISTMLFFNKFAPAKAYADYKAFVSTSVIILACCCFLLPAMQEYYIFLGLLAGVIILPLTFRKIFKINAE